MSIVKSKMMSGEFVLTAEIVPPLSAAPDKLLAEAAVVAAKPPLGDRQLVVALELERFGGALRVDQRLGPQVWSRLEGVVADVAR